MGKAVLTGRLAAPPESVRAVIGDPSRHTDWLDASLAPVPAPPSPVPPPRDAGDEPLAFRATVALQDVPLTREMQMVISVRPSQPGTQVVVETTWDSTLGTLGSAADELIVRPRLLAAQRQSLAALGELLRPPRRVRPRMLSLAD